MNPQIVLQASRAGLAVGVAGCSAGAASAATVIVATGGAAAVALAGYGVYRWLSSAR